jgi:hypothetical protein
MDLEQRIKELERRLEEMERMSEQDAPFDKATARRELLIQIAVEAADSILMGFSDGSIEELNYLTKEMASKFAERAEAQANRAAMLRKLERVKAS